MAFIWDLKLKFHFYLKVIKIAIFILVLIFLGLSLGHCSRNVDKIFFNEKKFNFLNFHCHLVYFKILNIKKI